MGSGPRVARLFQRLLAAIFAVSWISLGVQVRVLIGSHGLLPAEAFVGAVRALPWLSVPTLFRLGASDGALIAGIIVGLVLSTLALLDVAPRLCFAVMTALYLSYAVVARTFLSFQWDNLLLECGFLVVFLSAARRRDRAGARKHPPEIVHLLFLVLLWKLYAESGIAKWQSPLHDWQDGSAMTFYYETAPLPTRLGWYAHALPTWWHHLESWVTLAFELIVPFAVFGPRKARLGALAALTLFQIANLATANYGFFVYLALALHVFLLDEADVLRAHARARLAWRWTRARLPLASPILSVSRRAGLALRQARAAIRSVRDRSRRALVRRLSLSKDARRAILVASLSVLAASYVGISATEGLVQFADMRGLAEAMAPLREIYEPFRLVNSYHLFAAITRDRIEPEIQTSDGGTWTTHDFRYKPGDPSIAPPFVAPHQPRVDFQLWFYGLRFRAMPGYVSSLLEHVCRDPGAVSSLFREPLAGAQRGAPRAARVAFYRYSFTTPEERSRTGAWWTREYVGATAALGCE